MGLEDLEGNGMEEKKASNFISYWKDRRALICQHVKPRISLLDAPFGCPPYYKKKSGVFAGEQTTKPRQSEYVYALF